MRNTCVLRIASEIAFPISIVSGCPPKCRYNFSIFINFVVNSSTLAYLIFIQKLQEVVDKSRSYPHWKFYYTNVTRQVGNMTMASYEASLGRQISTNYPLVNFLMAAESDFFIGALGSTWCFLIDGMRNTGGKVMAGYLSVNKDRFW